MLACMHAHNGHLCDARWVPYAALAALAAPIAASAEGEDAAQKQGWSLLDLSARRRVFFKYEKRIRDHSAPDKARHSYAAPTLMLFVCLHSQCHADASRCAGPLLQVFEYFASVTNSDGTRRGLPL